MTALAAAEHHVREALRLRAEGPLTYAQTVRSHYDCAEEATMLASEIARGEPAAERCTFPACGCEPKGAACPKAMSRAVDLTRQAIARGETAAEPVADSSPARAVAEELASQLLGVPPESHFLHHSRAEYATLIAPVIAAARREAFEECAAEPCPSCGYVYENTPDLVVPPFAWRPKANGLVAETPYGKIKIHRINRNGMAYQRLRWPDGRRITVNTIEEAKQAAVDGWARWEADAIAARKGE